MSWDHVHLAVNHFPVVGTIGSVGLLAFGWASGARSVQRVALGLMVVSALAGIAAFISGNQAEEIAEHWPGVAESWIEDHEDAGKLAFFATLAAGAAAAFTFFLSRGGRGVPVWALLATLAVGAAAIAFLAGAANLGGRIRHPELRPNDAPGAPEREPVGALPAPFRLG